MAGPEEPTCTVTGCDNVLTPIKPKAYRQRTVCGPCYAAGRAGYKVEHKRDTREATSKPATRQSTGRRALQPGIRDTPHLGAGSLEDHTAKKRPSSTRPELETVLEPKKLAMRPTAQPSTVSALP